MIKTNLRAVADHIGFRNEFNCNGTLFGSIRPISSSAGWGETTKVGNLPVEHHQRFETACAATDFYVVYSYATPIAWWANGEWFVPPVRYSQTTSRHQGRLYMLLGQPGGHTTMAAKRSVLI